MKLATKGRYAVTALLDLSLSTNLNNGMPVNLGSIADNQNISLAYLEQLFAKLKKAHLVRSVRGAKGGYVLGKSPALINIAMIIKAVDEQVTTKGCTTDSCSSPCLTHAFWDDLDSYIDSYLSKVTLADLMHNKQAINSKYATNFRIL